MAHPRNQNLIGPRLKDRRFHVGPKTRTTYFSGDVFGKWTLLKSVPNKGWLCQCGCGSSPRIVQSSSFKTGRSKGCSECCTAKTRHILPPGEAGFNRRLRASKRHAKQRNLVWMLTDQQARGLFSSDCYYCGAVPYQRVLSGEGAEHSLFLSNGIDRVDNSQGYTIENCVSCCGPCNRAKDTMSADDFIAMARRIAYNRPLFQESSCA